MGTTHRILKKKNWMLSIFRPAHIAHTTHSILQEKIWMLPIIFTCTHCTPYPHQSKPTTMTGIYVCIIFTCTHRTHRTLFPQLLERKNMNALYFFRLHTLHTLPTKSCKKKYGCYLLFSPAHTHTHTHTYTHTHTHTNTHTHIHTHTHTHKRTHTLTNTDMQTHKHTHTHT